MNVGEPPIATIDKDYLEDWIETLHDTEPDLIVEVI